MEKQRKTFLSYSRVNKDFAIRLAKELKSEGFDIWLDQLDIPAGARWDREVEQALEQSQIFMIILTPASIESENVLDEIGYAIDNGKRILPVLLENCKVPLRLRRFQYVDFTNKDFDDGVESAKELLRSLIDQPTIPRMQSPVPSEASAGEEPKTKEEAERIAAQRAEEERLPKAKADADQKAKGEAARMAAQRAEEERLVRAKAEQVAAPRTEEERLTKADVPSIASNSPAQARKPASRGVMLGIFSVVGICVLAVGAYGLRQLMSPAATPAATEEPAASDVTSQVTVTRVEYDKGSFYQAFVQGQSGSWFDVLVGDDGSYTATPFEEVGRDATSIYLRDSSNNYNIQLDLQAGKIFEDYNDGNGLRERNNITATSDTPTGYAVTHVQYDGGEFNQTDVESWTETTGDGTEFHYIEAGRDQWSVYLYDETRNFNLVLDLYQMQVILDANDGNGQNSIAQIFGAQN